MSCDAAAAAAAVACPRTAESGCVEEGSAAWLPSSLHGSICEQARRRASAGGIVGSMRVREHQLMHELCGTLGTQRLSLCVLPSGVIVGSNESE